MDRSFRNGLVLLAGMGLIGLWLSLRAILIDTDWWVEAIGLVGLGTLAWAAYQLRAELGAMVKRRRGEIALYTIGMLGVFIGLGYFTATYTERIDMTSHGLFSLSPQSIEVLKRLEKPIRITYFYDDTLREQQELLELYERYSDKLTIEFYDPNLNPAQARLHGVQFAGTSVFESEGQSFKINGSKEADFTNAILKVSQESTQIICFLEGHNEADPFSQESHEHLEGSMGQHSHGLGSTYVLHEQHGFAKARHALEATNYKVEKILLGGDKAVPTTCSVLVVAGPKVRLIPQEVKAINEFLNQGGNAIFMLEPFIESGLEPIVELYGMALENDMIIDEASHFWSDLSSPAVTTYTNHAITREVPLTFYPGVRSIRVLPKRDGAVSTDPIVLTSRASFGETDHLRANFDAGVDKQGPLPIMVLAVRRFGGDYLQLRPEGGATADEANDTGKEAAQGMKLDATPGREGQFAAQIVVFGDSDFATNSFFHYLGNGNLFLNTVNYLASRENLIGIEPPTYDLPRVSLTNRQMKGTFFLAIVLIPAIAALVGVAVWWKQR